MSRVLLVLFVLSAFGFSHNTFGQKDDTIKEINRDSSRSISKKDFDSLVDESTKLLESKNLDEISDTQHINIMLCLNTIFMRDFENGRYEKLESVSEQKEYTKNITKRFPEWIPNRGMGFYFPKLPMELYGTPMLYAIFDVKE